MNFLEMSDDQIDEFLVLNQDEFSASGIQRGEIFDAVRTGKSVIERRNFGVAVINPMQPAPDYKQPFLWILYVATEFRGQGYGRKFIRQILHKYADTYYMRLYAVGARRSKFFAIFGFRVVERDNETGFRVMEQR